MKKYRIEKLYSHIITHIDNNTVYEAENLYLLLDENRINYCEIDIEELEKELESGYSITVGSYYISKVDKAYFESLYFKEAIELVKNEISDLYSYDDLKHLIISEIEDDNLFVALHLLKKLEKTQAGYYIYDRSMGTLEKPYDLNNIDDLIDYLDNFMNYFEEE